MILALAPFGARTRRRLDRGKGTISGAKTGGGRSEAESRIIQRSIEDDAFRQQLLADPKGAVEQEIGTRLPEEVRVVTVEETSDTIYLVLPAPLAGREGEAFRSRARVGGWWRRLGSRVLPNSTWCYPAPRWQAVRAERFQIKSLRRWPVAGTCLGRGGRIQCNVTTSRFHLIGVAVCVAVPVTEVLDNHGPELQPAGRSLRHGKGTALGKGSGVAC